MGAISSSGNDGRRCKVQLLHGAADCQDLAALGHAGRVCRQPLPPLLPRLLLLPCLQWESYPNPAPSPVCPHWYPLAPPQFEVSLSRASAPRSACLLCCGTQWSVNKATEGLGQGWCLQAVICDGKWHHGSDTCSRFETACCDFCDLATWLVRCRDSAGWHHTLARHREHLIYKPPPSVDRPGASKQCQGCTPVLRHHPAAIPLPAAGRITL